MAQSIPIETRHSVLEACQDRCNISGRVERPLSQSKEWPGYQHRVRKESNCKSGLLHPELVSRFLECRNTACKLRSKEAVVLSTSTGQGCSNVGLEDE